MLLPSLLRRLATAAAARHVSPITFSDTWVPSTISRISPATSDRTLFHLSLTLSSSDPSLSARHVSPGQFLPLRVPSCPDAPPLVLSIASPPGDGGKRVEELEMLVKRVEGAVSDRICGMREGDLLEVGEVMGKGFEIGRLSKGHGGGDDVEMVLMFATGSGISPIRSLIESGFNANKKAEVRLYYGARNLQRMAYQDRFKFWESSGVEVIPVLSRPDEKWTNERGYVQTAFLREEQVLKSSSTGAVLCGHRRMTQEITSILLANGVSKDKILTNI
ncbi:hypothetical protein LUZ60_009859 [Juncus effusus]|nr:hypothetical protein LUZ60_009859 [Juncus effusus]